jgi:uncharacterized glyoxalase superfamily protein PhnB
MLPNRSMPSSTVIPQLAYPDVAQAAAWLSEVFGFTVRLRIADHRIQMNAGDGHIVVVEQPPGKALKSSVMMRVADVDVHYARVVAKGVSAARKPETYPFGERQYSVADCGGHLWTFSQSLADVPPEDWGGQSGLL